MSRVVVLATALLTIVALSPSSVADDDDRHSELKHQQNRLDRKIDDREADLHEISQDLIRAQRRVENAAGELQNARDQLADLREQVQKAVELDKLMQEKLELAIEKLEDAREDLRRGREAVATERDVLVDYAITNYQSGGADLATLGSTFEAQDTGDVLDSLQTGDTLLDKQSVNLQTLEANEVLLELTEQRVEEAKIEVAEKREDARENLELKRDLEEKAEIARDNVAVRLDKLREVRAEVADAKAEELDRIADLEAERGKVEERLRKIALRRARQNKATTTIAPPSNAGGFFSSPVGNAYITSPYGMRLHPILNIYKLHDGTDFSAPCGVPIYAAASGRVSSAYYNAGYGNRIIVDHGFVRGRSLWTSYNHLSSYAVRVGAQVSKGQVIGYAGTTGYSTGCHLHFMVYVNGGTSDPMNWL